MITASQAFMNKVASGEVPSMRMQFIPASGEPFYLSDGDFWAESISFSEATSQSGSFTVGAAVIGEFNFTLNNFGGTLTDEIFAGAKVIPSVYYDINGTPEYLPKGVYYVASHKTNGNLIRVKAYDSMKLLDENKTTITYPTTVQAIVNAICTASGITLATQTIPNGTYSISLAPEADMTDRQLLSAVCEITGNFARMDENGNLYVGWYDFSNPVTIANTFDGKDLWTLPITLTGVRVNVYSGDNTYFYGTDDNVVTVSNNPLVYAGNGQEICNMLGARITGATFRPGSLPILSNPCLQSGDVLEITDNITHDTYLLPITELTYTKGLTESVSCSFENAEDADLRPTIEGLLKKSIDEASAIATQASELASETEQHFWFTSGTGSEAGAHIAELEKIVFEQNPSGGNLLMRSDGVKIRDGTIVLARFGTEILLGNTSDIYVSIGAEGMELCHQEPSLLNPPIAHFGYGYATNSSGQLTYLPYFSLGTRAATSSSDRGGYSMSEGSSTKAKGYASHAEGGITEASGNCSHAEGFTTHATGTYAHAEGFASRAVGDYSHAEGGGEANGKYSHAQGYATKASSDYQCAFGKYNIEDATGDYALIIGNGTSNSARSNALTVKWNGDVKTAGEIEDGNGTSISDLLAKFTDFFKVKEYTYAYSLNSGSALNITATNFGFSRPTGYIPIAILRATSGTLNVAVIGTNIQATGGGAAMTIYNHSSAARSYTASITVLYARSSMVTTA